MKKNVSMNDIVPLIAETVNNGGKFRLYPKGISMYPLIRQGKDSVLLEKCHQINKDDILLYRRKNGCYILHRVVRTEGELVFCGDNQHIYEYGITGEDVIAKVCGVYRKEKYKECNTYAMKLYLKYVILKRKGNKLVRRLVKILKRTLRK